MKNVLKLGIPTLALLLLVSGCGNTKVLKCTMSDSTDGMELSQTIKATFKKDAVTKMDMEMKMTVDDEFKDYIDDMADGLKSEFSNLEDQKGVNISTDTNGNVVTFKMTADLSKMDDEAKEELDMVGTSETYDQAKKELEEEGYTCK